MNRHSSRTQYLNAMRKSRNYQENNFLISWVVNRVIESANSKATNLLDKREFPVYFHHPLDVSITEAQKALGIIPYKIRESKVMKIIELLEWIYERDLLAPVADIDVNEKWEIELLMMRA